MLPMRFRRHVKREDNEKQVSFLECRIWVGMITSSLCLIRDTTKITVDEFGQIVESPAKR